MRSGLGEYAADLDPAWLLPVISVDEFFARDVRQHLIHRGDKRRDEFEAELAADRATVEAAMAPGDELRPWLHRFHPTGPSGHQGIAIVREGRVIKAWWTAILC